MTTKTDAKKSPAVAPRRVLLVDDHPIVRRGMRQLIEQDPGLCVCGEAGSAAEALDAMAGTHPDLVLMDISLGGTNGLDLTRTLHQEFPGVAVLVVSIHDENLYAERALRAGAKGYLMKNENPETVIKAIRVVLSGELFVSRSVASRIMQSLVHQPDKARTGEKSGIALLTDREMEVLDLVGQGQTTREIAEKMRLSVKTVETHKSHIKQKLGLGSATELVRYAVQWVEAEAR